MGDHKNQYSSTSLNEMQVVQIVLWLIWTPSCSKHMTGDRSQITNFISKFLGTVKFENDQVAKIMGYGGTHQIGNVTISRAFITTRASNPPSSILLSTFECDWDLLFQPCLMSHSNPPPYVDLQAPEVIAPIPEAGGIEKQGSIGSLVVIAKKREIDFEAVPKLPGCKISGYTNFSAFAAFMNMVVYPKWIGHPMVEKSKLDEDKEGKAVDPSHYRVVMIGTLLYLTASRLVLQFVYACVPMKALRSPVRKLNICFVPVVVLKSFGEITKPYRTMALDSIKFQCTVITKAAFAFCCNNEYQLADISIKSWPRRIDSNHQAVYAKFYARQSLKQVGQMTLYECGGLPIRISFLPPAIDLRVVKCNLRLSLDITSKDATLQLVYDILCLKLILSTTDSKFLLMMFRDYMQEFCLDSAYYSYRLVRERFLQRQKEVRRKLILIQTKQKPPTIPKEKKEKKSGKGKQKAKELETISEAVLTEAEQLKIITKRSRKDSQLSCQREKIGMKMLQTEEDKGMKDKDYYSQSEGRDDVMDKSLMFHLASSPTAESKSTILVLMLDSAITYTYGDTVTIKRPRDGADDDQEPSAGTNWGSKRRRSGKEPESTSAPREKTTTTAGKTTTVACLAFELNGWLQVGMASGMMSVKRSRFSKTTCATCWLVHSWCYVEEECYLVDPASSHMLVSKIKPCMFKKLVVGLWVGSAGPPYGVHRFTRPFCRRCAPGLNWLGRASGAVTLKKLECSKQAYALRTTAKAFAKDVFINQERKLGARRRSDTVLVSTINDADQGSADVAYRTPLAPYEKSKFLGSGGSMVARLKLKGIDGRAPPGVEPAA
ncbi:hypothetical protein Tco_0566854 [Tanacetum coccineum]